MLDTPTAEVPPLSLADEAADPAAFAAALGDSFERFGFAMAPGIRLPGPVDRSRVLWQGETLPTGPVKPVL